MYQFEHDRSPLKLDRIIYILITYFIGYFFVFPFIIIFVSEKILHNYEFVMLMQLIAYFIVTVIISIFAKPIFIETNYNRFDNRNDDLAHAIKSIIQMYGWMIVLNLILNFITAQDTSLNQLDIIHMSNSFPLITFIMAVVLAPIAEEVVFRGVIFRFLRNINYPIAIVVSSLAFGFLHVAQSLFAGNYVDILYISVYAMLGYYLGHNYERSGNIFVPIGMHMTLNLISMILMMLARMAG